MESDIFRVKNITYFEKQRRSRPKSIIYVLSKEIQVRDIFFDYFNTELIDKEVTQNQWATYNILLKENTISRLSNPKLFDRASKSGEDNECKYTLILAGKNFNKVAERERKERDKIMNLSVTSNRGSVVYKPSRPNGYFLLYDPMKKETFTKVQELFNEISIHKGAEVTKEGNESNPISKKQTKNFNEPKSFGALEPIILVSIMDERAMEAQTREVSYMEGKNYANENGMLFYEINQNNKANLKAACENIITIIEYNKRFEK